MLFLSSCEIHAEDLVKPSMVIQKSIIRLSQIDTDYDLEFINHRQAVQDARLLVAKELELTDDFVLFNDYKILFHHARNEQNSDDSARYLAKLVKMRPKDPAYQLYKLLDTKCDTQDDITKQERQFADFLKQFPDHTPAVYSQVFLLTFLDRYQDADALLERTRKQFPGDELVNISASSLRLAQHKDQEAVTLCRDAMAGRVRLRHVDVLYRNYAEALLALDRPQEALAFCALAYRLKPPHVTPEDYAFAVHDIANRCYRRLKKPEFMYFTAKTMSVTQPKSPAAWRALAECCFVSARYAEAKVVVDKLVTIEPRDASIYRLEARIQWGLRDEEAALRVFREGMKSFPDDRELKALHAMLLSSAAAEAVRDAKTAGELATAELAKTAALDPQWLLIAAAARTAAGDFPAAEEFMRRAEATDARGAMKDKIVSAKACCERRVKISFAAPPAVPGDGTGFQARPEWVFEITSEKDFCFAPVHLLDGSCLALVKNDAVPAPLRVRALEVLAEYLHVSGRPADAARADAALVASSPASAEYCRNRLRGELADKPAAEAAKAWEAFCAKFPDDADGLGLWAMTLTTSGDIDAAEPVCGRLLAKQPNHPLGLSAKALVLHRQKKYQASNDVCNEMLLRADHLASHANAYWFRAENYIALNKPDEALANLAVARRLTPPASTAKAVTNAAHRAYLMLGKEAMASQVLPAAGQ